MDLKNALQRKIKILSRAQTGELICNGGPFKRYKDPRLDENGIVTSNQCVYSSSLNGFRSTAKEW